MKLLKETYLPVQDIAMQLGFENHSSFSRLFYKKNNCWPIDFRRSVQKKAILVKQTDYAEV